MSDSRSILVALDDSLVAAGLVALLTQVARVDTVAADLTTFTEALAHLQPTIAFVGASLGGVSLVSRMGQLAGRFSATQVVVCLREDDPAIEDVVRLSGAVAVCNYRTPGTAVVAQTSALLAGQVWQAAVELGGGGVRARTMACIRGSRSVCCSGVWSSCLRRGSRWRPRPGDSAAA